jgi:hypothetical protein
MRRKAIRIFKASHAGFYEICSGTGVGREVIQN